MSKNRDKKNCGRVFRERFGGIISHFIKIYAYITTRRDKQRVIINFIWDEEVCKRDESQHGKNLICMKKLLLSSSQQQQQREQDNKEILFRR